MKRTLSIMALVCLFAAYVFAQGTTGTGGGGGSNPQTPISIQGAGGITVGKTGSVYTVSGGAGGNGDVSQDGTNSFTGPNSFSGPTTMTGTFTNNGMQVNGDIVGNGGIITNFSEGFFGTNSVWIGETRLNVQADGALRYSVNGTNYSIVATTNMVFLTNSSDSFATVEYVDGATNNIVIPPDYNYVVSNTTFSGINTFVGLVTNSTLVITNGLTANGLLYPTADSVANWVMKTDGSGNITFAPMETLFQATNSYTWTANQYFTGTSNRFEGTTNSFRALHTGGGIRFAYTDNYAYNTPTGAEGAVYMKDGVFWVDGNQGQMWIRTGASGSGVNALNFGSAYGGSGVNFLTTTDPLGGNNQGFMFRTAKQTSNGDNYVQFGPTATAGTKITFIKSVTASLAFTNALTLGQTETNQIYNTHSAYSVTNFPSDAVIVPGWPVTLPNDSIWRVAFDQLGATNGYINVYRTGLTVPVIPLTNTFRATIIVH